MTGRSLRAAGRKDARRQGEGCFCCKLGAVAVGRYAAAGVCCLLQSGAKMWRETQQAVHVLGRCQKKRRSKGTASREAGASAQRCCEKWRMRMRMVKVSHHNSSDLCGLGALA